MVLFLHRTCPGHAHGTLSDADAFLVPAQPAPQRARHRHPRTPHHLDRPLRLLHRPEELAKKNIRMHMAFGFL